MENKPILDFKSNKGSRVILYKSDTNMYIIKMCEPSKKIHKLKKVFNSTNRDKASNKFFYLCHYLSTGNI